MKSTSTIETTIDLAPTPTAGITRRSFIKRTGGTLLFSVIALHSFRLEAYAQAAPSQEPKHPIQIVALDGGGEIHQMIEENPDRFPPGRYRFNLLYDLTPDDLSTDKPEAAKTGKIVYDFRCDRSIDNGATYSNFVSANSTVTLNASNPVYPARGDVQAGCGGSGQLWFGNSTVGIQLVQRQTHLMHAKWEISVIWLIVPSVDYEKYHIHDAETFIYGPGQDGEPPAMSWDANEEDLLAVFPMTGKCSMVEIQVP
jgi:hypothetical protein